MNKEKIRARLHQMLRLAGISETELARQSGMNQPTVHRIMAGDSADPRLSNLIALVEAMGYRLEDLTAEYSPLDAAGVGEAPKGYAKRKLNEVPLLNESQIENGEVSGDMVLCPFSHSGRTYAFKVDSPAGMATAMQSAYGRAFPPGSIVFVDPDQAADVKSGDVVAAILTDENAFTFRVLQRDGGRNILMPLNPQFPNVSPDRPFTIIGKIIGAILPA